MCRVAPFLFITDKTEHNNKSMPLHRGRGFWEMSTHGVRRRVRRGPEFACTSAKYIFIYG